MNYRRKKKVIKRLTGEGILSKSDVYEIYRIYRFVAHLRMNWSKSQREGTLEKFMMKIEAQNELSANEKDV